MKRYRFETRASNDGTIALPREFDELKDHYVEVTVVGKQTASDIKMFLADCRELIERIEKRTGKTSDSAEIIREIREERSIR